MSTEPLVPFGTLRAHTGVVTAIQTPMENSSYIISASRDKSLIVWALHPDRNLLSFNPSSPYGRPHRRLTGHSHFIQDVSLSSDGLYALSASWDRDLRLWDLSTSSSVKRFTSHTSDVLSAAFSPDNRQIVSGGRDKSIRVWNTLGECKFVLEGHTDWVSTVRFSPSQTLPFVVSASWDSTVRVWDVGRCQLVSTLEGHRGYVNTVTVSPDGSLCASGGRDGVVILWDLGERKVLFELNAGSIIHAMCFSPSKYWLCAATERSVVIWDLENKGLVQELYPGFHEFSVGMSDQGDVGGGENGDRRSNELQYICSPLPPPLKKNQRLYCTSLTWSTDGSTLFTGYSDGAIRIWSLRHGYF